MHHLKLYYGCEIDNLRLTLLSSPEIKTLDVTGVMTDVCGPPEKAPVRPPHLRVLKVSTKGSNLTKLLQLIHGRPCGLSSYATQDAGEPHPDDI
jgi:hypothetical protein